MHGSTDPASTFQRQMEAHGFQVVSCEASYGEYDFGHDANSLVAELRAMGGPFSGSFIRYRVRERRPMQLTRNQYSGRQASTYRRVIHQVWTWVGLTYVLGVRPAGGPLL